MAEEDFGQYIKRRRQEIGLTQEEFSKKIGVSQNYIAKIETDLTGTGLKTLTKMAIALDIPSGKFIEYHLGQFEGIAILIEKRDDLDNKFRELPTNVKELLLKIASIIEKYL